MRPLLLFTAAFTVLGSPIAAQVVIVGHVVDEEEHTGLDAVTVQMVASDGRVRATTVTNATGGFTASVPFGGGYRMRANKDGYLQTRTPFLNFNTLRVSPGDTIRVQIVISPRLYVLAPLTVTATSRSRNVYTHNFEQRRRRGMGGSFVTREDILRRNPYQVSDMLVEMPGVFSTSSGTRGARQLFMNRAFGGQECPVQVYLDGVLANRSRLTELDGGQNAELVGRQYTREYDGGFSIDDLVSPSLVEAIEVFRGTSTVPPEFLTYEARCGVIAIWTRSGEGRRRGASSDSN